MPRRPTLGAARRVSHLRTSIIPDHSRASFYLRVTYSSKTIRCVPGKPHANKRKRASYSDPGVDREERRCDPKLLSCACSSQVRFVSSSRRPGETPGRSSRDACSPRAATSGFESLHGIPGARRGGSTVGLRPCGRPIAASDGRIAPLQSFHRNFRWAHCTVAVVSSQLPMAPSQRCSHPTDRCSRSIAASDGRIAPLQSSHRNFRWDHRNVVVIRRNVAVIRSQLPMEPSHRYSRATDRYSRPTDRCSRATHRCSRRIQRCSHRMQQCSRQTQRCGRPTHRAVMRAPFA